MAGNFCGAALAYFGADVTKVEPPGAGDALRSLRTADTSGTSLWWRSYVSTHLLKQLFNVYAQVLSHKYVRCVAQPVLWSSLSCALVCLACSCITVNNASYINMALRSYQAVTFDFQHHIVCCQSCCEHKVCSEQSHAPGRQSAQAPDMC